MKQEKGTGYFSVERLKRRVLEPHDADNGLSAKQIGKLKWRRHLDSEAHYVRVGGRGTRRKAACPLFDPCSPPG
jgi:hypothetical protein